MRNIGFIINDDVGKEFHPGMRRHYHHVMKKEEGKELRHCENVGSFRIWEDKNPEENTDAFGSFSDQLQGIDTEWYLASLYIEEKYRRQGFGSSVMEHIVKNYKNCVIWLLCTNDLIPFYERFGFKMIREKMKNGKIVAYTMAKIN